MTFRPIVLVYPYFAALLLAPGPALAQQGAAATALQLLRQPTPPVLSSDSPAIAEALLENEPDGLAAKLMTRPELVPGVYGTLAAGLACADASLVATLGDRLAAAGRAWTRRLCDRESWSDDEISLTAAVLLVEPARFAADPDFRRRMAPFIPRSLDAAVPAALRDRLLRRLSAVPGFDFDLFEDVAAGWGAIPRRSRERELASTTAAKLELEDPAGPIAVSVYSLPSALFHPAEALAFLAAVRRVAPHRRLLVLCDPPLATALEERAEELGLDLLPTWGRAYSPWPRDPLTFLQTPDGGRTVLLRPNSQATREADLELGRALVQTLPPDLDAALGGLTWRRAEVPFHNGQILAANGALWTSLHAFEPRILELLGLGRVPVEDFAGPVGERYVAAARTAAAELAALYSLPVRFVHALPPAGISGAARAAALAALGGGAGFDLDSLLTILPRPSGGGQIALVGDLDAGAGRLDVVPVAELDDFAASHGRADRGGKLRQQLAEYQSSSRARRLDAFVEEMARYLGQKMDVKRLPLLLVPPQAPGGADFLLGWNNVVLERRGGESRAEGFESGLESVDAEVRRIYAAAGWRLDLLRSLGESVRRGGGYRCASQHLRMNSVRDM